MRIRRLFALFTDVDECANGQAKCNQKCYNNVGSYTCDCYKGYNFTENGVHECKGIYNDLIIYTMYLKLNTYLYDHI